MVSENSDNWTYGAEHELSDWDTRISTLPKGFARSPDYTIVNSNGIAAQPNVRVYPIGGEINTQPTDTMNGQVSALQHILDRVTPRPTINHRSNLHLHIRVPGLKDNLKLLKQVQAYVHTELPKVLHLVEPIPSGMTPPERKRARRRRVSHHTFLTAQRLEHQLNATNVQEFFEREVPLSKRGQVMWHAQPRCCVNLRQLLQTDTIEFRHFPGTLDTELLWYCFRWCHDFLLAAVNNSPVPNPTNYKFPKFPVFDLQLEIGYQATAAKNGLSVDEVKHNIGLIEQGEFHEGCEEWQAAATRAGCLSR